MDRPTVRTYETRADAWIGNRRPDRAERAADLGARVRPCGLRADLGSGPGWHAPYLGTPIVLVDAARAMLRRSRDHAPNALRVCADLEALPFATGSLAGAWASKSYVHVPTARLPMALAELHAALEPDAPIELLLFAGEREGAFEKDDLGDRFFALWPAERLRDVLTGAGFELDGIDEVPRPEGAPHLAVRARRALSLADSVGPGMRVLVCGLNPSLHSARAGIAFFRAGNRFWPAALAAGIVTRDRDPFHALRSHGVGLTDLAKRATARAAELAGTEYSEGLARVERTTAWLAPKAVCFVGLAGWRHAVERRARAGWQSRSLGGAPVYLMPSTSGLNGHASLDDLTAHLASAAAGPAVAG